MCGEKAAIHTESLREREVFPRVFFVGNKLDEWANVIAMFLITPCLLDYR
jgi:hypothetical protein